MNDSKPNNSRKKHHERQLQMNAYRLKKVLDETRQAIERAIDDELTADEIANALKTTRKAVTEIRGDEVRTAALTYPREKEPRLLD